jgi:hypothetical protein
VIFIIYLASILGQAAVPTRSLLIGWFCRQRSFRHRQQCFAKSLFPQVLVTSRSAPLTVTNIRRLPGTSKGLLRAYSIFRRHSVNWCGKFIKFPPRHTICCGGTNNRQPFVGPAHSAAWMLSARAACRNSKLNLRRVESEGRKGEENVLAQVGQRLLHGLVLPPELVPVGPSDRAALKSRLFWKNKFVLFCLVLVTNGAFGDDTYLQQFWKIKNLIPTVIGTMFSSEI